MIKTFSYSDENNEFLDMEQNNYFFEGEDCKVLFFSADKNEYLDIVNFNNIDDIKIILQKNDLFQVCQYPRDISRHQQTLFC